MGVHCDNRDRPEIKKLCYTVKANEKECKHSYVTEIPPILSEAEELKGVLESALKLVQALVTLPALLSRLVR